MNDNSVDKLTSAGIASACTIPNENRQSDKLNIRSEFIGYVSLSYAEENVSRTPRDEELLPKKVQDASAPLTASKLSSNTGNESSRSSSSSYLGCAITCLNYVTGSMPAELLFIKRQAAFIQVIDICLRGASQVLFINNPICGLFILAAIAYSSWSSLLYAVVGLLSSNATAYVLAVNRDAVYAGLYGYNGILLALAIELFSFGGDVSPKYVMLIPVAIMSAWTSILMVAVGSITVRLRLTPFTFPFQLSTWIWLLAAQVTFEYFPVEFPSPRLATLVGSMSRATVELHDYSPSDALNAVFIGVSQVFLVNNAISGVIILIGIFISSPLGACLALMGSSIGAGFSMAMGVSKIPLVNGLYGYNPCMTAVAIGGMFIIPTVTSAGYTIFACVFTTILNAAVSAALAPNGLPSLTFPFTLTSWIFILVANNTKITGLIPVSLSMMTTHEHHRQRFAASKSISAGFTRKLGQLPLLSMRGEDDIIRFETLILPVMLCHYASTGDVLNFKRILGSGPDVSNQICVPDYDGRTPLMIAAAKNHAHFAKYLLSLSPSDINAVDSFGFSAIDYAVTSRNSFLVRLLAFHGARPAHTSSHRRLMQCVHDGNMEVLLLLLESNIGVNGAGIHMRTPLHLAACLPNRRETLQVLISFGADANLKDSHGNTSVDDAKRSGQHENECFLEAVSKADGSSAIYMPTPETSTNKYNNSPLGACHQSSNRDFNNGFGSSIWSDEDFITLPALLCIASAQNSTREVSYLLGNKKTNFDLTTQAINFPRNSVEFKCCDVNMRDYNGRSPLAIAASHGSLLTCRLLLELGADVNCVDDQGATPLWSAVTHGTADAVRLLIAFGGKVPEDKLLQFDFLYKLSSTPNNQAAWERLLLVPNFDFTQCDYDGVTALHVAARYTEIENVQILIFAGADPLAKDRWGLDPQMYSHHKGVHYAIKNKSSPMEMHILLGKNRNC